MKEITYQLVLEDGQSLINVDGLGKELLRFENKQKRTLVFGKQEEQSKYARLKRFQVEGELYYSSFKKKG